MEENIHLNILINLHLDIRAKMYMYTHACVYIYYECNTFICIYSIYYIEIHCHTTSSIYQDDVGNITGREAVARRPVCTPLLRNGNARPRPPRQHGRP